MTQLLCKNKCHSDQSAENKIKHGAGVTHKVHKTPKTGRSLLYKNICCSYESYAKPLTIRKERKICD